MALTKKVIPLKAGQVGFDSSTNPQMTEQAWLKAENCRWTRKGALTKREGFEVCPGTNSEAHAAEYKGGLVTMDRSLKGFEGSSWPSKTAVTLGTIAMWDYSAERHQVPQGTQALQPNSLRWEARSLEVRTVNENDTLASSQTAYLRSYSTETGRQVAETSLVSSLSDVHARLVYDSGHDRVYCFYISAGAIRFRTVDTSGAISSETNTALTAVNARQLDVVRTGDQAFMGITRDGGGAAVKVFKIDSAAPAYTSATHAYANVDACGCWYQASGLWVGAFYDHTTLTLNIVGYDEGLVNVFAPMAVGRTFGANEEAVNVAGVALTSTTGHLYYTWTGPSAKPRVDFESIDFTTPATPVAGGDVEILPKAQLINKPIVSRGASFVGVTQADHNMWWWIASDGTITSKGLLGNSGSNAGADDYFISETAAGSDSGDIFTCPRRILDADGTTITGTTVRLAEPAQVLSVETAESLLIGDSLGWHWDGVALCEQGYLIGTPETPTENSSGATTGVLGSGSAFQWCITYQWYDANGQLHESAPSLALSKTFASGSANWIYIDCPTLCNTNRTTGDVRIALWRTTLGGTIFYRLGSIANDESVDVVTFQDDTITDAVIDDRAKLYTTGSNLANGQPPTGGPQALHQSRQFVADAEHPATVVEYTKQFASGETALVAPEWGGNTLSLTVPPAGGDITALMSYRDRLLIFKESRIYAVAGTGLSSTGLGTGYNSPYLLNDGEGAEFEKSVVELPTGVAFTSPQGFRLLNSSLKVTTLGEPVRYYTELYDYRSAVHLPAAHLAVWVSDQGPALAYDYLYGLWAVWTGTESADATRVGTELILAGSGAGSDKVRAQVADNYTDGTDPYATTLESGWFSFAGLGDYSRIYRLTLAGYKLADHTINVAYQYDLDPEWQDEVSLDTSGLTAFDMSEYFGAGSGTFEDQAMLLETDPARQKVMSLRVRLRDTGQTGKSFTLTGLAAVVGLKEKGPEIGAGRRLS